VSVVEVLVATAVTTSVMGGVLAALGPAHATFVALADAGDVRQRLRAGVEAISRDLLAATEALPFPGGILIVSGPVQHTYYAKSGALRVDDGQERGRWRVARSPSRGRVGTTNTVWRSCSP
jgi:hypothetical protein